MSPFYQNRDLHEFYKSHKGLHNKHYNKVRVLHCDEGISQTSSVFKIYHILYVWSQFWNYDTKYHNRCRNSFIPVDNNTLLDLEGSSDSCDMSMIVAPYLLQLWNLSSSKGTPESFWKLHIYAKKFGDFVLSCISKLIQSFQAVRFSDLCTFSQNSRKIFRQQSCTSQNCIILLS